MITTLGAARLIQQGSVVAYPTEAVWGLGCDPQDQAAVLQILALKQRPVEKGLILIAANLEQLLPYLHHSITQQQSQLLLNAERPTTWLVPCNPEHTPEWICGAHELLAVRISEHPTVQQLALACGFPIVSTSANPQGLPAAKSALEVQRYFGDDLPICEGQCGNADRPSTIRNLLTGEVLRE
jgi:L-threonylcarbamoyladenylate synthase